MTPQMKHTQNYEESPLIDSNRLDMEELIEIFSEIEKEIGVDEL